MKLEYYVILLNRENCILKVLSNLYFEFLFWV